MNQETALAHFTQARHALQKAKTIDEVKAVRDAAERLRLYLRQANESLEMQNDAAEIRLRAERRAGEMLKEAAEKKERKMDGRPKNNDTVSSFSPPTLKEVGITPKQSSRWQSIAAIPEEKFEKTIKETKQSQQELTQRDVLKVAQEIRKGQAADRRMERITKIAEIAKVSIDPIITIGKFPLVYADPPWQYDFISVDAWKVENHYPTMTTLEICALPIKDITTKDAILFMWATAPKLVDAMQVVQSWGFTYKTCAIWDKEWTGMGNYFRIQHELLLIATKGSIPPPTTDNRPASIVRFKRSTKHSEKPEIFYEIIEAMYPELPKVELFARATRKGWKTWGNETEKKS